jgi:HEAT repeat protein
MAGNEGSSPPVPKPVQLFVIRLSTTTKSLRLYPTGSEIPRRSAQDCLDALREAIGEEQYLEFDVGRDGLRYNKALAFPRSQSFIAFAREFYKRNLAAIRFFADVTNDELLKFLSLIIEPPEQVAAQGGMEAALSELGIANIAVSEVATRVVEAAIPGTVFEPPPEGEEGAEYLKDDGFDHTVEEVLESAGSDQARDKRLLMRVLRDRRAVAEYLLEARDRGTEGGIRDLAKRIGALTRSTRHEVPDEQSAAMSVIAEAILELSPQERGELYQEHLLGQARRDESMADLIEKLGVDEVVDSILTQIEETPAALTGLSRAVRNLTLMNASAGENVLDLVVSKMTAKGHSEGFIGGMADTAFPKGITSIEQFKTDRSRSVGTVLKLIDMTPDGSDVFVFDQAAEPLRQEATRGTTDGDVIEALVAVAILEKRTEQFSQVMSMLDDSVGYLVEAGEADVAADVAEALSTAAKDPSVAEPHRMRMAKVVEGIARPESLAKVTATLRHYRSDTPEYQACKRLLGVLGESIIDPLLEVLAEESDMTARKALIELISATAKNYIPELGARLGDRRWFLVRNVVSILASTHSPEALTYMQRTLRHSDARVRRETIRGLASIRSSLSDSMLAAALEDDDPQNVQLATRFLGSLNIHSAVPALEQLARGVGRGNRDSQARVEAIDALTRIKSTGSIPILEQLSGKRWFLSWLFGGGRDKDVRAAATEALGVLRAAAQAQGVAS